MNNLTGAVLDHRYQVIQFVGQGGMADVYKVWDVQRSVYLAMKVLKEDLAEDEIFLRRFQREADALSQLQHPNIIRSYGLVEIDNLAFLLMDFIEGSTLRREIHNRKAPWPADLMLSVMRPVCAALNFAHTQGFVHCDVKPANIMLTGDGWLFLADFGIARLTESATTATLVGAGTPAYMSPEQIQGEDPKPQTDIYALGIVLYELLTGGERPFTGEMAKATGTSREKVCWEQVHLAPPPVRRVNPNVPVEVEAIVFKCLEKNPAARYASAMELYAALECAYPHQNSTPAPARPSVPFRPVIPPEPPIPGPNQYPRPVIPPPEPEPKPVPPLVIPRRATPWWIFGIAFAVVVFMAIFAFTPPPQPPPATQSPAFTPTNVPAQPTAVKPTAVPNTPAITVGPTVPQKSPTIRPTATAAVVGPPPCTASGQYWERTKDKSSMICIPAGSFLMGFPNCKEFWCQNEAAQGNVDVAAFWIDRDEITNARFQQFVGETSFVTGPEQAGVSEVFGRTQPVSGANWRSPQGPGSSISNKTDHPVVQMNWFSANAYCKWANARLPSEAQWEKAARGTKGGLFPWGSDMADKTFLNAAGSTDGFPYTAPVGSFPAGNSSYGLRDMAGNAFEWTRSMMKEYPYKAGDGREIEGEPGPNDKIVSRGGSFYTDYGTVRSTWRAETAAQQATDGTGFRCVINSSGNP